MRWTIETQLIAPDQIAWINERYEGYKRGDVSELAICGEMVQVYQRHSPSQPFAPQPLRRSFARSHCAPYIPRDGLNSSPTLQNQGWLRHLGSEFHLNDWVIEEGAQAIQYSPPTTSLPHKSQSTNGVRLRHSHQMSRQMRVKSRLPSAVRAITSPRRCLRELRARCSHAWPSRERRVSS